jgi:hypothetical protein
MPGSGGGEWQVEPLGIRNGLLILGHERSEEADNNLLAEWLREQFPWVAVTHSPSVVSFQIL